MLAEVLVSEKKPEAQRERQELASVLHVVAESKRKKANSHVNDQAIEPETEGKLDAGGRWA